MTKLFSIESVHACRLPYAPVLSRMNHCMEKKAGAWKGTLVPLRVMMLTVKFC
jgi:hypothetical protein